MCSRRSSVDFPPAAGTDHRIGFACFQRGGKVLQHRFVWCVAVAGMPNLICCISRGKGWPPGCAVCPARLSASFCTRASAALRAASRLGNAAIGLDDEVHQIDKGDDDAWRDAPAGKRQPGTQQKDAQLRRDAGKRPGGLQQRLQLQAGAFLLL